MNNQNKTINQYWDRVLQLQDEYTNKGQLWTMTKEDHENTCAFTISNLTQTTMLKYSKTEKFLLEEIIFKSDWEIMKKHYKELGYLN